LKDNIYELQSSFCGTFSSPKRLEILDALRDGERSVSALLEKLSIGKTNLSQHLAVMKSQGVLESRREGQHVYYYIANRKILQAYDLIQEVLVELMGRKLASLK
jgi:DNA-binding transcriptional ArsR family regulator